MTAWRGTKLRNGKPRIQEHDIQAAFIEWCELNKAHFPELEWMHAIINGAKLPYSKVVRNGREVRVCRQAGILKAEGLKPGPLDCHLPVARGGYHSIYIEFKTQDNDLTPEQRAFWVFAAEQGNYCVLCRTWIDAANQVSAYLSGQVIRTCRICGRTEYNACPGGCCWVGGDLCSACV